ncbi:HAD family hydrolase [Bacillus sp. Marseille-P3661]|uniref:HAD family hydrolase n=1 Tax=Bacillus sp. Marseille-P3661 TaxID=1936234 RepID=UPI000C835EF2|nr:HAD family hydrolase [Bacillus sp. Marseille-P3661]
MSLNEVSTIIFDLDGTLYEDTHHFDYFAKKMAQKLPIDLQNDFMTDYSASLNGQHPLQIGRIYDVQRDLILVHENQEITAAFKWDGTVVPDETIKQYYPQKVQLDLTSMISVGDLWWVPSSIAYHYKLDSKQGREAFLETREYMMSDAFQMTPIPGLKELLEDLYTDINLVLFTNSPETDSEAILAKLGLSQYFHKKIFEGKKPVHTKSWFNEIKEWFTADYHEMLSVGDNWINEIQPANELGCKTISIDAHEIGSHLKADYKVTKMSEAITILKELIKK